jgi:hypothetical protein
MQEAKPSKSTASPSASSAPKATSSEEASKPKQHSLPEALLAGLMQGVGEREEDQALLQAGQRLAQQASGSSPKPSSPSGQARGQAKPPQQSETTSVL